MKSLPTVGLQDVQAVYSGAEGDLWELLMGEQIHIGGFGASLDLAKRAGVQPGQAGVDLCCCTGAGMRFLVRFCGVKSMVGVDATERVVARGRERCRGEKLDGNVEFTLGDVCASGLPSGSADFIWGEDAWCYVVDKQKLISEAARIVKDSGVIAFTDWVEGPNPMTEEEARRFLAFMKFSNLASLGDYTAWLERNGCVIRTAEDTGRFPGAIRLYLEMLEQQLTFDALKIVGFDTAVASSLMDEMRFTRTLAEQGKLVQGRIIATKALRHSQLT